MIFKNQAMLLLQENYENLVLVGVYTMSLKYLIIWLEIFT